MPWQAPWITQSIKNFLRKKNRAYRSFVRSGQSGERLEGILGMISQRANMIEDAKQKYLMKIGQTLSNPNTGQGMYWSLMNQILNKVTIPVIPPLLENDIFVLDFTTKAEIFTDYFILQCTVIDTGSAVPNDVPFHVPPLSNFHISDEKILRIIRSLNPNKAHGWDNISVRMIKISDEALVVPLRLIFENCKNKGIFPQIWKQANVVPVHKKSSKQLKQNYRPISLLPIFWKNSRKVNV